VEPVTDIPTVVLPLTVAPEAGLVNVAVNTGVGDVVMPFFTVTLTVEPPVLFDESFTVATSGCVPSTTIFVSKGIETGPLLAVVVEPIALPPSVSVYVFVGVPVAVALAAGAAKLTVGFCEGGGVVVLLTVTGSVAVAVLPAESVTAAVSVWSPLGTVFVSHEYVGPVPGTVVVVVLPTVRLYV